MRKPTIIVSGLARCGTSLTMRMLNACGVRCAGEFPSFETWGSNVGGRREMDADWLHSFAAVKILDPQRWIIPRLNAVVLWLDRDEVQQAMSQVKFLQTLTGLNFDPDIAPVVQSLIRDREKAIAQFDGLHVLELRFEQAIDSPLAFAKRICLFLREWDLNPDAMAACVRPRRNGANCEPCLDIEMALISQA